MRYIFLILCFLSFLFSGEIIIDDTKNVIYRDIDVFKSSKSIEDIIDSKNFDKVNNLHKFLRQSFKEDTWLHFKIKNQKNKQLEKTFLFRWKNANLKFYLVKDKRIIFEDKLNDSDKSGVLCTNFKIDANEMLDVYIFYEASKRNDEFEYLNIINSSQLFKTITQYESFYGSGFFLGILVIMTLQSIFAYLTIREKNSIYYALFQLSIILIISDFRFFIYDVFENYPLISFIILKAFLPSAMFVLSAVFTKSFLNTKEKFPIIDMFINVLIIYFIFLFFYKSFTLNNNILTNYINILTLLYIYAGVTAFLRGDGSAFFYTVGTTFFIIFNISYVMHDFLNVNFEFTKHVQIYGSLEALFLSIAVQHKIRNIFVERQKAVQQQLEDKKMLFLQSKMASMGEMIGNIAHQWRQPLNSVSMILANIQLQQEYNKLTPQLLEKKVDEANTQLKFMSNTIEDFRNFFSHKKGKESMTLEEVCQEAIKLTKSTIVNNHIELSITYKNSTELKGMKSELIHVLIILITNAKDAFIINDIKNRKLSIRVYKNIIFVKDNAGGIPEDIIDNIFDPYFTTKDKKSGTGLGLYMAKMIIENNFNSELRVKTTKNNTEFSIIINP